MNLFLDTLSTAVVRNVEWKVAWMLRAAKSIGWRSGNFPYIYQVPGSNIGRVTLRLLNVKPQ